MFPSVLKKRQSCFGCSFLWLLLAFISFKLNCWLGFRKEEASHNLSLSHTHTHSAKMGNKQKIQLVNIQKKIDFIWKIIRHETEMLIRKWCLLKNANIQRINCWLDECGWYAQTIQHGLKHQYTTDNLCWVSNNKIGFCSSAIVTSHYRCK